MILFGCILEQAAHFIGGLKWYIHMRKRQYYKSLCKYFWFSEVVNKVAHKTDYWCMFVSLKPTCEVSLPQVKGLSAGKVIMCEWGNEWVEDKKRGESGHRWMGCANGEGYETCKSSAQSPNHHRGPCVWPNTDGSLHCLKQPPRNKSPSQNKGASASITVPDLHFTKSQYFLHHGIYHFCYLQKVEYKDGYKAA